MLTIHVWPKRLKAFLLTHPLYKSPGLCFISSAVMLHKEGVMLLRSEEIAKPFFINTCVVDKFVYFAYNVITEY